jgi:hypothetical protein
MMIEEWWNTLLRYLQPAGGGFVIRFFRVSFSLKLAALPRRVNFADQRLG